MSSTLSLSQIPTKAYPMGFVRKKYDAEIEYLESTGAQRIDTGINCFDVGYVAFEVECNAQSQPGGTNFGFGSPSVGNYSNSAQRGRLLGVINFDTNTNEYFINYVDYGYVSGSRIIYKKTRVVQSKHAVNILREAIPTDIYPDGFTRLNIFLFAAVNSNTTVNTVRFIYSNLKIYSFQIWNKNDELIRDFIPVRTFNNGFLYDKVTDTLFTSASDNKQFILGPDI